MSGRSAGTPVPSSKTHTYGSLLQDFEDSSVVESLQSLSFDDTFVPATADEDFEGSTPMLNKGPLRQSVGRNPGMIRVGVLALGIFIFILVITLVLVARAAALTETVKSGISSVFS